MGSPLVLFESSSAHFPPRESSSPLAHRPLPRLVCVCVWCGCMRARGATTSPLLLLPLLLRVAVPPSLAPSLLFSACALFARLLHQSKLRLLPLARFLGLPSASLPSSVDLCWHGCRLTRPPEVASLVGASAFTLLENQSGEARGWCHLRSCCCCCC